MATIEERLAEQLDEKDAEIGRLREQIEALEQRVRTGAVWAVPTRIEERPEPLLVPRLEIVWEKEHPTGDWYSATATYRLVYRHLLGRLVAVALGRTRVDNSIGRPPIDPLLDRVELPFRDGAHLRHDAKILCLPAYAICEDRVDLIHTPSGVGT